MGTSQNTQYNFKKKQANFQLNLKVDKILMEQNKV